MGDFDNEDESSKLTTLDFSFNDSNDLNKPLLLVDVSTYLIN